MKKITFLFIALISFCWQSYAQVTIGDGTNEVQSVPIEPYYGYTYSQSIYLQSEINAAGDITSIQWYYSGTSDLANTQDIVIWMAHTTKTDFADNTDWVDVAGLTQVYAGTLGTPTGPGWMTITLDAAFTYNNTDNLIIAVDENTDGYNDSTDDFYCTAVGADRSIYYRNDSTNPDPAAPPATASGAISYIPNVILGGITQSCPTPTALVASNITDSSADLGWTADASQNLWDIELGAAGFTPTGTPTATGVTNPYNATALMEDTAYEFYVRADCGGGDTSSWAGPFSFSTPLSCADVSDVAVSDILTNSVTVNYTVGNGNDTALVEIYAQGESAANNNTAVYSNNSATGGMDMATGLMSDTAYDLYVTGQCGANSSAIQGPVTFTTACDAVAAPYTEDFENAGNIPDCWANSGAEDWDYADDGGDHVGNGGNITGSTSSNNYYAFANASGEQENAILISPLVDVSSLTTPALSFYEISDAEDSANSQLDVEVWDGTAWNNVGTYNTNTSGWELKVIDLSSLTITGPVRARFTFTEPTPGDFDDDIAIDDVSFAELPSCNQPSMLTATNIMATSADLGWTADTSQSLWDIELGTAGFTPTGTPTAMGVANPYGATSLMENTAYDFYVRADCGGGDTSDWTGPFSFTTPCNVVSSFPAITDFSVNPPACWDEAGSGEVADGPGDIGASVWKDNRAYTDAEGNVVNSNVINLYLGDDYREWLLSPVYDIPAGTGHSLVVNVAVTDYSFSGTSDATDTDTMGSDDEVQLLQSTDGGNTWTNITTWNVGNQPAVTGTEYIADLAAISGNVQFAIWGSDGATDDAEDFDFHVGAFRVVETTSLSTSTFENEAAFTYFPNPVKNTLTLNAQNTIEDVTMYNMLGQEVLRVAPNTVDSEVDMSALQNGTYFVKVTINNVTKTVRVIKQ